MEYFLYFSTCVSCNHLNAKRREITIVGGLCCPYSVRRPFPTISLDILMYSIFYAGLGFNRNFSRNDNVAPVSRLRLPALVPNEMISNCFCGAQVETTPCSFLWFFLELDKSYYLYKHFYYMTTTIIIQLFQSYIHWCK